MVAIQSQDSATVTQSARQRTDVFLLELARQVALHERGLADTTITNEDELELGDVLRLQIHRKKQCKNSTLRTTHSNSQWVCVLLGRGRRRRAVVAVTCRFVKNEPFTLSLSSSSFFPLPLHAYDVSDTLCQTRFFDTRTAQVSSLRREAGGRRRTRRTP